MIIPCKYYTNGHHQNHSRGGNKRVSYLSHIDNKIERYLVNILIAFIIHIQNALRLSSHFRVWTRYLASYHWASPDYMDIAVCFMIDGLGQPHQSAHYQTIFLRLLQISISITSHSQFSNTLHYY